MAPDNTNFYISQHNDGIIAKLTQAVFSRKGFMLLTGEVGLGKTTLSRRIIQILEHHDIETCLVLQSFYQGNDLLKEIIRDFGMSTEEVRNDLPTLMKLLNDFLLKKNKQGVNCAILIDDAQNLSVESLELVRLISNLEADREKLVQILLVGQPELLKKLNTNELRQLKSRVTIKQVPIPLRPDELGTYIQFKLNRAGDPGKIIVSEKTLRQLYRLTGGNIRRVNVLMDQALQYACQDRSFVITPKYLKQANKELAFKLNLSKQPPLSAWIILILILIIIGMVGGAGLFYYQSGRNRLHPPDQALSGLVPAAAIQTGSPDRQAPADEAENTSSQLTSLPGPRIEPEIPVPAEKSVEAREKRISDPLPEPGPVDAEPAQPSDDPEDTLMVFLGNYGLEKYEVVVREGLASPENSRQMNAMKTHLFDHTGYELIRLPVLPDTVRDQYDVLSAKDPATGRQAFYLFWKPVLKIVKFYSGYTGEEITDLQSLLKRAGYYRYNVDGIVGQIIMKSVKGFQQKNNLPVTGFPDPETVFLLVHQDRQKTAEQTP